MKTFLNVITIMALLTITACSSPEQTGQNRETTPVTDENYSLAETQIIMESYVQKIAKATGTTGVGVFMHNQKGADPQDKTIMRSNFDTIYSWAVFDLSEPVTIIMPETDGRYQTTWVMSEEHYNPFAFTTPGEHILTRENVGSPYAIVVVRTQANVEDPADVATANKLQQKLSLKQKHKGHYKASHTWDQAEILKMREKYQQIAKDEKISADVYFGKKGLRSLKEHNCGTAMGWGGFTPEQAAYVSYYPTTDKPQTLTLQDLPAKAFWSITVYDQGGFARTDTYNINSQFAKENTDGSVVIHFGGDTNQNNYMETFPEWTFILRMYLPKDNYLDGSWIRPELEMAE